MVCFLIIVLFFIVSFEIILSVFACKNLLGPQLLYVQFVVPDICMLLNILIFLCPIHTAYIKVMHIRSVHTNKVSLWLNCRTLRVADFLRSSASLLFSMANVQYPAGQGAPADAALPVAQEIQPADELPAHGAQAAAGVAQVVQQQEALPAAENVAQEIQQAASQVPQQAMEQVQ